VIGQGSLGDHARPDRLFQVSRTHLSNIEQGRSRTGWKGLREMATYYGYGMKALIEEVGACPPVAEPRPRVVVPPAAPGDMPLISNRPVQSLSNDEMFILGLYCLLDKADRQFIAKQMLQLVQARADKIGAT
jgi:hypothetical protein